MARKMTLESAIRQAQEADQRVVEAEKNLAAAKKKQAACRAKVDEIRAAQERERFDSLARIAIERFGENVTWFYQYHLTHFIRTRIMQRERYDHSRAFFGLPEAVHRWRCRFFCWPSNSYNISRS